MTRDELIEKVARAIATEGITIYRSYEDLTRYEQKTYLRYADAVIDIVADEAWLVIERLAPERDDLLDAIRALKSGDGDE